jgi:hypothetical protein
MAAVSALLFHLLFSLSSYAQEATEPSLASEVGYEPAPESETNKVTILPAVPPQPTTRSVARPARPRRADPASVTLGPIARHAGHVQPMSQEGAIAHCRRQHMRLPTLRELATAIRGRQAIRGTAHGGVSRFNPAVVTEIAAMGAAGYYPVYVENSDRHTVVDFYLQAADRSPRTADGNPSAVDNNLWFWSSTNFPGSSHYAYHFNSSDGDAEEEPASALGAVRCIR